MDENLNLDFSLMNEEYLEEAHDIYEPGVEE